MSQPIICNGCGARVSVPDDYARNKMQCPECGVMCVIPPRTAAPKKAVVAPTAEEPRFEDDESTAPPTFAEAPVRSGKGLLTCRSCGELVRAPARKRDKQANCPVCGATWSEPIARVKQKPTPSSIPPAPDEFAGATIDDDPDSGNPYGTADPGARRCSECTEKLEPDAAVCVRCGFDLRSGRKLIKQYQRLEMSWNSGMSLSIRISLFVLCQAAALTAVVAGLATLDNPIREEITTFACTWLVYAAMTGFLLGTYDSFHLTRSKNGKLTLTRTWRIAFWPLPTRELSVGSYSSVASGAGQYAGFWDWLIFCILLSPGIVPALLYWYFAIHKTEFFVGLCSEHEHLEEKVYRGWDKERMREIQYTLRDAITRL